MNTLLYILLIYSIKTTHPVNAEEPQKDIAPLLRWAVTYHNNTDVAALEPYSLLLLDANTNLPVHALVNKGKLVLGYVPFGEVADHRYYFERLEAKHLLIEGNPSWPGSHRVDLRNPLWAKYLIEELIPTLLHKGFNGLFLDTVDNAGALERRDPQQFKDMQKAAIALIQLIREHYPNLPIMQNRGYELLEHTAPYITMLLAESFLADYDFENKTYIPVPENFTTIQQDAINLAQEKNPELLIFTLDYWHPDDTDMLRSLYAKQRAQGYHPYVATIALDRIIPEPD